MTLAQFYRALRKYRGEFRVTRSGYIRCRSGRCPIERVAGVRKSDVWAGRWRLRLEGPVGKKIIAAADKLVGYSQTIRVDLLKALGLREAVAKKR